MPSSTSAPQSFTPPSASFTVPPGSCIPFAPQWLAGVSADVAIINGVAGQVIKLRKLDFGYIYSNAAGENVLHLRTSPGGTDIGAFRLDAAVAGAQSVPCSFDFEGFPLPAGQGLVAHIEAAPGGTNTIACGGVLSYTQA